MQQETDFVEPIHEAEAPNRPHRAHGLVQGKNLVLLEMLENTEHKNNGIIMVENYLLKPSCGVVYKISPNFEHDLYPDVKVGAHVNIKTNAADEWKDCDGVHVGLVDAKFIRYVYQPARDTSTTDSRETFAALRQRDEEIAEAQSKLESRELPSMIIVK